MPVQRTRNSIVNGASIWLASLLTVLFPGLSLAGSVTSEWAQGENSKVRLIAGFVGGTDEKNKLTAGVQIELSEGWKTYWRTPGDSGGMPPEFDWSKSRNLASATVLFPAPIRLKDPSGDSIGYKHAVIFPVVIAPINRANPVQLKLNVVFGVCATICIPEEHELSLILDPTSSDNDSVADLLRRALDQVPTDVQREKRPNIVAFRSETIGSHEMLIVETQFPEGAAGADLFVEAADGGYVPLPEKLSRTSDGRVRFRIDLSKSDILKAKTGRQLRLTLVSDQSSAAFIRALP